MFQRILEESNQSFFLFGPRGTGKSTWVRDHFKDPGVLWIDLLTESDDARFRRDPDELSRVLSKKKYGTVVIDEIQKAPKLLDIVHREIERHKTQFILTGSSARKLRRGSVNLLAGRAFSYSMHPLTHLELKDDFNLQEVLRWGSLPKIYSLRTENDKSDFLRAYAQTYLREEVISEQIVRRVDPFRDFLSIAAQVNGQPLNFSKIAKDIGVDDKTVRAFFTILEDTLLGFHLPPFHRSIRKRQREASKFFIFDLGVKRAMEQMLSVPVRRGTYEFGNAFEHFVVVETIRLNEYKKRDFKLSYLRTKDGVEADLIIEMPDKKDLLVEIKSSSKVSEQDCRNLERLLHVWDRPAKAQIWSLDEYEKKIGHVDCSHWMKGLKEAMHFGSTL